MSYKHLIHHSCGYTTSSVELPGNRSMRVEYVMPSGYVVNTKHTCSPRASDLVAADFGVTDSAGEGR
jgi:hypothetical protein